MLKRLVVSTVLLPVAASATPVLFDKTVPPFGCFAASASRHLGACVIGDDMTNMGLPTTALLVFAPLAPGVEPPASVTLFDKEDAFGRLERQTLDPKVRARANKLLAGFSPIAPVLTLSVDKNPSARDFRITQRKTAEGGENEPPRFETKLEHRIGTGWEVIDEQPGTPTRGYTVLVYANGLVERTHSMAQEGSYGTSVDVWLCRKACVTIDR
jgi:hypothetical protein